MSINIPFKNIKTKKSLLLVFVFSGFTFFAQQNFTYVIKLNTTSSASKKVSSETPEKALRAYFKDATAFTDSSGTFKINTKTEITPYNFAVLMESQGVLITSIEKQADPNTNLPGLTFYFKPAVIRDPQRAKQ